LLYDRYWPAVQDEESALTPEVESRLRKSHAPVIAFTSTNIAETWPQMVHSSAQATGGAVKFVELKGWGHLDVLAGTKAKTEVFEPVLGWIKQHQK
jgi:hypothetical protein